MIRLIVQAGAVEVRCETEFPSEALEFLRGLEGQSWAKVAQSTFCLLADPEVTILRALMEAGPAGVPTQAAARFLGAVNGKGLAGRARVLGRRLQELDFEPDDVFETRRGRDGQRRWFGGSRLEEALEALSNRDRRTD
jgi:hypothetical protein